MTDPKKRRKPADEDLETLSRVDIDGNFTVPLVPNDETAHLQRRETQRAEPTVTAGDGSGDTMPAAGTSRATAIPKSGRPTGSGSQAGKILGGRFEILHPIGKGGMGEVFLVRDRQIENREVALKLVLKRWSDDPRFRDMFFGEIRAAQGFVSENAVQVRDCGELQDGQLFLTMDYVEGESLTALLKREKSLLPRHALEIARQVLLGLSSGHERGIIHRDVKPSNVMLAARIPKTGDNPHGVKVGLLDFGIAGLTKELEAGRGPGTPHYMSPEQATGEKLDTRSDLFAVGVMLFEMISGTRPFDGRTQQEITQSVIETDPIPLVNQLDGLKKPIKRILRKALQKKREKRFSSAAEFIKAIESSTSFKQTEGAPGWVAAVAGIMTITTAGLAWTTVNELARAGDDRKIVKAEVRKEFMEPLERELTEMTKDRDNEKTKNANLIVVSAGDKSTIESLRGDLATAKETSTGSLVRKNEAISQSNAERMTQETVITLLKDHIADLVTFSTNTFGQYGSNLCAVGEAFDDLTEAVIDGMIDNQSEIIGSAINISGVDENAPGVAYMRQIEDLARQVHASGAGAASGDESFVALAGLRAEYEKLSSVDYRRAFERTTSSMNEGDSGRRMWLALKRLEGDELADHLVARGKRQSGAPIEASSPSAEPMPQDPEGVLTEAEQLKAVEDAKENVAASDPVQRKEALSRFLRLHTPAYVVDALYGAQLDEATRDARLAALDQAFAALESRLNDQHARLLEAARARVSEIEAQSELDVRTAGVIRFLDDFGVYSEEYAQALIEGLVTGYREKIVVDGQVQLSELQDLPSEMDSLVAHVLEAHDLEFELPEELVTNLAWIAGAQRWYLRNGRSTGAGDWFATFVKNDLGHPISSYEEPWKKLFAFQVQLKRRCDLMQATGSTRLFAAYSANKSPAVQTDWQHIRIVKDGDDLVLEERFLKLNGRLQANGRKENVTIDTPNDSTVSVDWKDSSILRLTELPETTVTFVEWEPQLPEARALFKQTRSSLFEDLSKNTTLEMLAGGQPLLCLEVPGPNGSSYLIHPVLGVVRQNGRRFVKELVHLELDR